MSSFLYAQSYNPKGTFKDYTGTTVITTQVRAYRNKAVLRGTEADKTEHLFWKNLQESNSWFTPDTMVDFGLLKPLKNKKLTL